MSMRRTCVQQQPLCVWIYLRLNLNLKNTDLRKHTLKMIFMNIRCVHEKPNLLLSRCLLGARIADKMQRRREAGAMGDAEEEPEAAEEAKPTTTCFFSSFLSRHTHTRTLRPPAWASTSAEYK